MDTDNDGEISQSEAEAVLDLKVDSSGISDLTGIEAFINLFALSCEGNQLNSLSFDGVTNIALQDLYCEKNLLSELDVSNCPYLVILYCGTNYLSKLDLSNNSDFFTLAVAGKVLGISNMPSLYEVCLARSPEDNDIFMWHTDTTGSPNVYFTANCSSATSLALSEQNLMVIYPNPATHQLTLELPNTQPATLELYSASGKCVYSKEIVNTTEEIDVSGLSRGLYFLQIRQEHATHTEKIILQ